MTSYWEIQHIAAGARDRLDALLSEAVAALEAHHLSARQRRRIINKLLREMGGKPRTQRRLAGAMK
jgi:hypothetical protein